MRNTGPGPHSVQDSAAQDSAAKELREGNCICRFQKMHFLFGSWNSDAAAGWWVMENGFVLQLTDTGHVTEQGIWHHGGLCLKNKIPTL